MNFVFNKNLGFDKEQVLIIPAKNLDWQQRHRLIEIYRQQMSWYPGIMNVSATSFLPGQDDVEGRSIFFKGQELPIQCMYVSYDFIKTLGIPIVEGRDFSREFSDRNSIIVNEAFISKYGKENWDLHSFLDKAQIIAVVKNFHFQNMYHKIEPRVLYLQGTSRLLVRIQPEKIKEIIHLLEAKCKEVTPNFPFEFTFLDWEAAQEYRQELKWEKIVTVSAILSILIAVSGIFALSAMIMNRRTKEIGIRKVLGASIVSILQILTQEYVKWVVLANVVAWPVAWWSMNKWLQNFAYRIDLSWWMFVHAGGLALGIALLTVIWQAIRAATANPVESLRYE